MMISTVLVLSLLDGSPAFQPVPTVPRMRIPAALRQPLLRTNSTILPRLIREVSLQRQRQYAKKVWVSLRGDIKTTLLWLALGRRRTAGTLTASQRSMIAMLRVEVARLKAVAAKRGMPLDDATLRRYLEAAGWSLQFRDRSVARAVEHTVEWRASAAAVRKPELDGRGLLLSQAAKSGDRVLRCECKLTAGRSPKWWQHALVSAVELASRDHATAKVCVLVDCRGAPGSSLFDAARSAASAFPLLSTHYPGRLGHVYVLGAGPASRACWWFIKNLLDANTRAKISFVSDTSALKQKGFKLV
ncbi:hypothetical protein CTAYLR_005640 [Chrysophaeum taylorii]|uniref:CRAL-TRIO domain-containing protein n=1 Tax=Chrysophaeum taylorii TaxID=2483200 RepID=A0AAD7UNX7_9STRA|nr:hypothetical protein CTAYLR_005640 [Chrysophaeum taylorii]